MGTCFRRRLRVAAPPVLTGLLLASLLSAQTPSGIHPRPTPGDYPATQQTASANYAAALLSASQVKRLFAGDISESYLVFEVACYPASGKTAEVMPADFRVRSAKGEFIPPADAFTVAAVIQQDTTPSPQPANDTSVTASAGVGYERGTDPYTGVRTHGLYTETGVGVAHGADPDSGPIGLPPPGSTPYDRRVLENQLAGKALPEGTFSQPVAGLLYFPASRLKKKPKGGYDLEYLSDASGAIHLQVPAKSR